MSQEDIQNDLPPEEVQPEQPAEAPPAADEDVPVSYVEVNGQKMAPLEAVQGERARGRRRAERAEQELSSYRQRAEQLEAQLRDLQSRLPQPEKPKEPEITVSDDEALAFAREYELYNAQTQQPDVDRARRLIIKQETRIAQRAKEQAASAIQAEVTPLKEQQLRAASANNFGWAVSQKDANGDPLFPNRADAEEFARYWAEQPVQMAAVPEVAQMYLQNYVGGRALKTKRPQRAEHAPVFSESPGGGNSRNYQISAMERHMAGNVGMKQDDWAKSASKYDPTKPMVLGE